MSKTLWTSKVFWFNILTAASTLAGVLPLEPDKAVLIVNGINIGLRLITNGPATVLKDAAGK